MSDDKENTTTENSQTTSGDSIKLNGLFAFKVGMSTFFDETGQVIPVTVLKYEPLTVSQVKTKERDGYDAIQVSCKPKRATRTRASERGHLKKSGFENGAYFVKEVRQDLPEGIAVGNKVALESLAKGDVVKISARSKGRGFAGVVKRHGFGGGPGAHGSTFHRRPGSVGNRTWPGRVMKGKRFPGHFGDEMVSVKNVKVVDVLPEMGVLMVKGAVPGARNSLVRLVKG